MYWNIDYKLKKKQLLNYIMSQEKNAFISAMVICVILDIIGVLLFLGSILVFTGAETLDGKIVGTLIGTIFLIVFVIVSEWIRKRTIMRLGSPYSEMEKEFIHFDKAGFEFGYHDTLDRFSTSMDLYQIYYEDINDINYLPELMLLTITGVAQLTVYDDFQTKRINHNMSQRKFYPDSKYSIIVACNEAENILNELNKKIGASCIL